MSIGSIIDATKDEAEKRAAKEALKLKVEEAVINFSNLDGNLTQLLNELLAASNDLETAKTELAKQNRIYKRNKKNSQKYAQEKMELVSEYNASLVLNEDDRIAMDAARIKMLNARDKYYTASDVNDAA